MTFTSKTEKLVFLLKLIKGGDACNTDVLSNKICVSPRTLRRYIDELRNQGHQIGYCTLRNSYYLIDNSMVQK